MTASRALILSCGQPVSFHHGESTLKLSMGWPLSHLDYFFRPGRFCRRTLQWTECTTHAECSLPSSVLVLPKPPQGRGRLLTRPWRTEPTVPHRQSLGIPAQPELAWSSLGKPGLGQPLIFCVVGNRFVSSPINWRIRWIFSLFNKYFRGRLSRFPKPYLKVCDLDTMSKHLCWGLFNPKFSDDFRVNWAHGPSQMTTLPRAPLHPLHTHRCTMAVATRHVTHLGTVCLPHHSLSPREVNTGPRGLCSGSSRAAASEKLHG